MTALSGSKLHRAMTCLPSSVLPHEGDDLDAKNEPARDKGKAIHSFLEHVNKIGPDKALEKVKAPDSVKNLCKMLDLERMPRNCATEVAYAYNWRSQFARELGRNLGHRDYHLLPEPPTEDEIPCTLDLVGWAQLERPGQRFHRGYVGDYKTGHMKYPRPSKLAQTMLGALCLRSTMGIEDCVVELIYVHDDGGHHTDRETIDEWVMDDFQNQLYNFMAARDSVLEDPSLIVIGDYHEGKHCDYCGAFRRCQAKMSLVKAIPEQLYKLGVKRTDLGELELDASAITARNAGAAYEMAERIESIAKRIKQEVCGLAWHQPVPLADGRVIQPRLTKRRSVDGSVAVRVLEEKYGREEALKAVSIESSLQAIQDAVVRNTDFTTTPKPRMHKQDGTGVVDQVIAEIAARGGIEVNEVETCQPGTRPRGKKALPPAPEGG